jgi:hypothetical protein
VQKWLCDAESRCWRAQTISLLKTIRFCSNPVVQVIAKTHRKLSALIPSVTPRRPGCSSLTPILGWNVKPPMIDKRTNNPFNKVSNLQWGKRCIHPIMSITQTAGSNDLASGELYKPVDYTHCWSLVPPKCVLKHPRIMGSHQICTSAIIEAGQHRRSQSQSSSSRGQRRQQT